MLQVKTKVNHSEIAGLGLFADQFIFKGTLIWRYNDLVDKTITPENYLKLNDIEKEFVRVYTFKENENYILCSDNAKYTNHSDTPNTNDFICVTLGSVTYASKDIQIGEEIVSNYKTFDANYKSKGII